MVKNLLFFDDLCDRFCNFFDSVLWSIEVIYSDNSPKPEVRVGLRARDNHKNMEWTNVLIFIHDVSHFNFQQLPKTDIQVLSNGLHIGCFDSNVYFDFGYNLEKPNSKDEFLVSNVLVIGETYDYETSVITGEM